MIKHLDVEKLNKYIEDGYIKRTVDSETGLQIFNYTEKCQYENFWNEYTLNLRGHVYDKDYNLVMPAMSKFFNFYQYTTEEQKNITKWMTDGTKFEVSEKVDGCLSLIFPYKGHLIVTSKSTFDNYVTSECRRLFKDKLFLNDMEDISLGLLVETLSPETKQIVKYDTEEIRVITSYNLCETDNEYLQERPYDETKDILERMGTGLKMVDRVNMSFKELQDWCKTSNWEKEGFVVKCTDIKSIYFNNRVKFKSEDYLRVAAIKSYLDLNHLINVAISYVNTSKNTNWIEHLNEMLYELPDELMQDGTKLIKTLRESYDLVYDKIFNLMQSVKDLSDKELGMKNDDPEIKKYKPYIYWLRKNQDLTLGILKIVKNDYIKV